MALWLRICASGRSHLLRWPTVCEVCFSLNNSTSCLLLCLAESFLQWDIKNVSFIKSWDQELRPPPGGGWNDDVDPPDFSQLKLGLCQPLPQFSAEFFSVQAPSWICMYLQLKICPILLLRRLYFGNVFSLLAASNNHSFSCLKKKKIKNLCFHCTLRGFNPCLGNQDPTCHMAWPKISKK